MLFLSLEGRKMKNNNPFNYYIKAIKNYVTFRGRATRPEFWFFALFNGIITIILTQFGKFIHNDALLYVYALFIELPYLGVAVRRMHDIDRSGWWILVPFVNAVFFCLKGTEGENRFGPQPD